MDNKQHILGQRNQEPEDGVLYIVATPIGNLNDITLRAINILKKVSTIACEDTRTTKKLLRSHGISNKLISLNDHNIKNKIDFIISELNNKKSFAIVSEAGMPLINDPGELLVKFVKNNNFNLNVCFLWLCSEK